MKIIKLILFAIIIITGIIICVTGGIPSWFGYFSGWGLLFLYELRSYY